MMHNRLNWLLGVLTFGGLAAATATAESTPEAFSLAPPAAAAQPVDAAPPQQPHATAPVMPADACREPCCDPKPFQVTLGFRTWFTRGNSDDAIQFATGALNQFRFRDLEATVYEFNIDTVVQDRFVFRVDLGFATIDEGNFQSVTTPAAVPPASPIDIDNDDLFYMTVDAGYRLFSRGGAEACGARVAIDAFVGYQHWHETYIITSPLNVALLDDKYTWNSVRLGVRGSLESGRWASQARVAYVPWTHFESRAIDLTQTGGDYKEKADGGKGVMADFTVSYRVWQGLSLDVGYQVFHLSSERGSFRDATRDLPMEDAHSSRHGLLLGLNYRF